MERKRGRGGTYSREYLGGGDVLVGWEAEPTVTGVGIYGDEARKAAEEARGRGPGIHVHRLVGAGGQGEECVDAVRG